MNATKRAETIILVKNLNFIPFIIAVVTLYFMIASLNYKEQIYFERIVGLVILTSLPILGIVSYVSLFFSKKYRPHSYLWILGCINGGIWMPFGLWMLLIFIIDPLSTAALFFLFLFTFFYMGYLAYLNYQLYKYDKKSIKQTLQSGD